jgi:antitoxin CptB
MDIIMGGFIDAEGARLDEAGLAEFERLLDEADRDVFAWISGEAPTPPEHDGPVFRRLKAFHTHSGPIHS